MDEKARSVGYGNVQNSEGSSKGTKSSRRSQKHEAQLVESEDISLTQLEIMANKKKLNKVNDVSIAASEKASANVKKSATKGTRSNSTSSSSLGSVSTDTKSEERRRKREKNVQRENSNDNIRKEKAEYLYKLEKATSRVKGRMLKLDMTNSLDEIRNEYERINNDMKTERSVAFFKRMLLLGVQGVEMVNTNFDPLGVDLDGWSEAMGYSLENQEYDEVMAELYEKYKGSGQMSPEMKLMFMIISSATMFTVSKKISKMDSSNAFKNIIGSFVGGKEAAQPPQPQYSVPNEQYIPSPQDLSNRKYRAPVSETTEDFVPSKLKGPSNPLSGVNTEGVDINNILQTMNERKREKMAETARTDTSDEVFKNIPMNTQKRGRGRPRKTKVSKAM